MSYLRNSELTLVMLNFFMHPTFQHVLFLVNPHYSSLKHIFSSRSDESVDPDQMPSQEASRSGSAVFSKQDISRIRRIMANKSLINYLISHVVFLLADHSPSISSFFCL